MKRTSNQESTRGLMFLKKPEFWLPALLVLIALTAIWKIPQRQVGNAPLEAGEKARIDAETSARVALIQGIGGFLVFVTAGVSWLNLKATQRNVLIAEEKQITERFSKAVEMLSSESIHTRLGGIYALERIAKDSARDHWQVMELLTAFVREKSQSKDERSPIQIINALDEMNEAAEIEPDEIYSGVHADEYENFNIRTPVPNYIYSVPFDVQAVLVALGRRSIKYENGEEHSLDLRRTDLRGVVLSGNFTRINFESANLEGAKLNNVDLTGAKLTKANMELAQFEEVNLSFSDLENAQLHWAKFIKTKFQNANLKAADLGEASFKESEFSDTDLTSTDLFKAELCDYTKATLRKVKAFKQTNFAQVDLSNVILRGKNLKASNLQGANLNHADLTDANLESTELANASFESAILRNANLRKAHLDGWMNLTDADLENANLTDASFSPAPGFCVFQIKAAKNWRKATYSPEFRQELDK